MNSISSPAHFVKSEVTPVSIIVKLPQHGDSVGRCQINDQMQVFLRDFPLPAPYLRDLGDRFVEMVWIIENSIAARFAEVIQRCLPPPAIIRVHKARASRGWPVIDAEELARILDDRQVLGNGRPGE